MRPLSFLLPPSLFVLASSALAQALPYPQAEPLSTVQVTAPRTVWLRDDHARQIAGYYAMSNGWQLKVRPSARFIDATIDSQPPLRLLHVAPDKFVSSDGNVTMEFNRGEAGNEMLMRYVPDPRLAHVVVISSPMAQR